MYPSGLGRGELPTQKKASGAVPDLNKKINVNILSKKYSSKNLQGC